MRDDTRSDRVIIRAAWTGPALNSVIMTGTAPALRDLLAAGDMPLALAAAAQVLTQHPRDAEACFVAAVASSESGRIADALSHIKIAVETSPDNAEYLAQHARILLLGRREGEAMAAARSGVAAGSDNPLVLDTLGCVFARLGAHDEALPLFEHAVDVAPEVIEYRFNLASTLGFFGRVDDAAAHYEAIIARQPAHGRAHLGLVGLRRSSTEGQAERVEAALSAAQDVRKT